MSDSATPWTAARQASLPFTVSWSLLKLMSIESVMPANQFILCRPFSFCYPFFPVITLKVTVRWILPARVQRAVHGLKHSHTETSPAVRLEPREQASRALHKNSQKKISANHSTILYNVVQISGYLIFFFFVFVSFCFLTNFIFENSCFTMLW